MDTSMFKLYFKLGDRIYIMALNADGVPELMDNPVTYYAGIDDIGLYFSEFPVDSPNGLKGPIACLSHKRIVMILKEDPSKQ